jgi:hypothetical protein
MQNGMAKMVCRPFLQNHFYAKWYSKNGLSTPKAFSQKAFSYKMVVWKMLFRKWFWEIVIFEKHFTIKW